MCVTFLGWCKQYVYFIILSLLYWLWYPAQSQHCCRMLFVLDVVCVYWFVMYLSASLYTDNQHSWYYYKHLQLYVLESAQTVEEKPWDPMHNSVYCCDIMETV